MSCDPLDLAVAVVFLGLVILPIFILSWLAVTGLSLYILLFANDSSTRRRGALIMLALTVPMLWGRLLFQLFDRPLLEIDAMLAASLLGTDRVGNMVGLVDGSGYMVILPACSSLHQHVARISVLCERHPVGEPSVVRY